MVEVFDWVTSNAFFGRCAFVFLFQLTLGLVLWLFFNHSLRKRYFSAIPVRDYVENSNISLSLTWEQKQELRRQRRFYWLKGICLQGTAVSTFYSWIYARSLPSLVIVAVPYVPIDILIEVFCFIHSKE